MSVASPVVSVTNPWFETLSTMPPEVMASGGLSARD